MDKGFLHKIVMLPIQKADVAILIIMDKGFLHKVCVKIKVKWCRNPYYNG